MTDKAHNLVSALRFHKHPLTQQAANRIAQLEEALEAAESFIDGWKFEHAGDDCEFEAQAALVVVRAALAKKNWKRGSRRIANKGRTVKIEDLCGDHELRAIRTDVRHPFDGDASGIAIQLDDTVAFFFEDPSDGYRSCVAAPLFGNGALYEFGGSPEYVRVPVSVSMRTGSSDGLEMTDRRNGKVVLVVGTDYYPSFICSWRPENVADNESI